MDQGTEPIRQDIDQIRASMTDKMERIEAKIKGTVDETTGSVKRMVDVKYQIAEHPWTALGISILAGIALGSLGDSDEPSHRRSEYRGGDMSTDEAYQRARSMTAYPSNYGSSNYGAAGSTSYGQGSYGQSNYGQGSYGQSNSGSTSYTTPGYSSSGYDRPYSQEHGQFGGSQSQNYGASNYNSYQPSSYSTSGNNWSGSTGSSSSWNGGASQSSKPGVVDQISRQFGGEIEMLKSAAVSSLVSVIRDTIRQNFPSMHQEMERMRRDSGSATGSSNWSSGSTSGTSSYGSTATDYAHSAANNPSHVTSVSDPARGSSMSSTSNPDDLQRDNTNL
jgi:ElaB/YqjD/DUF883 family membrane-anchored ribosome-binding protein